MANPLASANTAEVVLTFLESVGRRSEAELYLRLFRKLPKESFAIIAPGGPVVREGLGSLVEQLRFLADLKLFAPVLLGLFDPENALASAERLVKRLSSVGLVGCPFDMGEADLVDKLTAELRAERVPVLYFTSREGVGSAERLQALGALTRALDTRKLVLLRRRGGIALLRGAPPDRRRPDGRVSVINLRTDLDLLKPQKLGKRDSELVQTAQSLIDSQDPTPLLVSVTSPWNLLKELFTVRGAGTLIKRGSEIESRPNYSGDDVARLTELFERSFGRSLSLGFFERPPLRVYVEAGYRGAAILHPEEPAPYLSKFAVEPEAQGEGLGNDLWQAIGSDFPSFFWRARPDNPINSWYQTVCDGMVRLPRWTVFFRGIEPTKIAAAVARADELPPDFSP